MDTLDNWIFHNASRVDTCQTFSRPLLKSIPVHFRARIVEIGPETTEIFAIKHFPKRYATFNDAPLTS